MSEDRRSLFARMTDRRDVADFVKEIEKHPCIYDQKSLDYNNVLLKRRTWSDIAKKYKSTVPDCKEKWRKIRIAFMRSYKQSKSGNPPSRPYYLASYLHFICPDGKVTDNIPSTSSAQSPSSSDESGKFEIEERFADNNDEEDNQEELQEESHDKVPGETETFSLTSTRRELVDFVKEIEKHPCLYDSSSYQYSNKLLKRRTWFEIAKKFKSTVYDCKEKWRKIRTAYARSLKQSKSSTPPGRPYHLAEYLHFITPGKKIEVKVPTSNSATSPNSSDQVLKLEIEDYDHLAESGDETDDNEHAVYLETNEPNEEFVPIHQDKYRSAVLNLSCANMDRLTEEVNNRLQAEMRKIDGKVRLETQKSCLTDEHNPRRMFLMSLLPDIETLNEQEMRTFRREVIALLDNIVSTRESVIVNSSNNSS